VRISPIGGTRKPAERLFIGARQPDARRIQRAQIELGIVISGFGRLEAESAAAPATFASRAAQQKMATTARFIEFLSMAPQHIANRR
jgi:hypothetical protein